MPVCRLTKDFKILRLGTCQDMATAYNQLIGASLQLEKVAVYAVDLKRPYDNNSSFLQHFRYFFHPEEGMGLCVCVGKICYTKVYVVML